jgi:hypothetical protein
MANPKGPKRQKGIKKKERKIMLKKEVNTNYFHKLLLVLLPKLMFWNTIASLCFF